MAVRPDNYHAPHKFICDAEADLATIPNPKVGQQALCLAEGTLHYHTGSEWQELTGGGVGGGAPTDASYLVGAADGDLSAEIVVGATPGGELGGTWASPTVDASHGGGTHAASQAAAESTAASALASHEADTTNVHGVADISALATDTEVATAVSDHAAAADPHTGYVVEAATPGGELGGTYATPTVDATHSGSAHHDAVTVGTGLDLTGQLVDLDLSEVAAGGELAGFMDAPTVDETHSGSSHAGVVTTHEAASDPHAGYLKEADIAAKGDLFAGTADNTVGILTVGGNEQGLVADSSQTSGHRWGLLKDPRRPSGSLYETMPRSDGIFNTAVLASTRVSMVAIWLPAGITITSISFMSATTAASVPLNQVFGLYDSSRALLRSSDDNTTTAWAANTVRTLSLTSTFDTTYSGLHYLAILVVATTVPTLMSTGTNAAAMGVAPIVCGTSTTAVTALPDSAAAIMATGTYIWAWVS